MSLSRELFWTDWAIFPYGGFISKSSMDGSNIIRIRPGFYFINSISLDLEMRRLYCVDGGFTALAVYDYDGIYLGHIMTEELSYSAAVAGDYVYWTSGFDNSISVRSKFLGGVTGKLAKLRDVPYGMIAVSQENQPPGG